MLDPHFLVENPERVKDSLRRRFNEDLCPLVDTLVELGATRSTLLTERDTLRADRNRWSKEIGGLYKEGRGEEAEQLKSQVQAGNVRIQSIEATLEELETRRSDLSMQIPNLIDEDTPAGQTEEENVLVRDWGTPREVDFEIEAHVEIGTKLGILDLERAAKLTGARFAVLMGAGARLERALINFYLNLHTGEHGYTEVMVPYMVHRRILEGTGQLPKFEDDLFKMSEPVNGSDTFLIPTAEVPVTNLHREEILELDTLPKQYACFTPCFRSEAGSAGRDVRGIIRQHQFHKVELVWISTPDQSADHHERLVGHAERCLQLLELPYRVVRHCGGELSFNARRCYDLEVWMPSQECYREISSVSHFGDYQARRMALRYRPEPVNGKKSKARLAHTLNGSGLAVGRAIVAILENNVQEDGSVLIPKVLIPYMGGLEVIRPPAN